MDRRVPFKNGSRFSLRSTSNTSFLSQIFPKCDAGGATTITHLLFSCADCHLPLAAPQTSTESWEYTQSCWPKSFDPKHTWVWAARHAASRLSFSSETILIAACHNKPIIHPSIYPSNLYSLLQYRSGPRALPASTGHRAGVTPWHGPPDHHRAYSHTAYRQ